MSAVTVIGVKMASRGEAFVTDEAGEIRGQFQHETCNFQVPGEGSHLSVADLAAVLTHQMQAPAITELGGSLSKFPALETAPGQLRKFSCARSRKVS